LSTTQYTHRADALGLSTPQHRAKHRRIFGPPTTLDGYRERARALEAELAQLRARLEGRAA